MRLAIMLVASITLPLVAQGSELDNWPGKSEGYGAPFYGYSAGTCGDFVRTKEGSVAHQFYMGYLSGFITGVNNERKYGGNVLGRGEPKIDDFALMVRAYCAEHPFETFTTGIGVSLKKLKPVTWRDLQ